MSESSPWRHATKNELRLMVTVASRQWKKAIQKNDMTLAASIGNRLAEVNRALDDLKENDR
jgi:hypothetical protein